MLTFLWLQFISIRSAYDLRIQNVNSCYHIKRTTWISPLFTRVLHFRLEAEVVTFDRVCRVKQDPGKNDPVIRSAYKRLFLNADFMVLEKLNVRTSCLANHKLVKCACGLWGKMEMSNSGGRCIKCQEDIIIGFSINLLSEWLKFFNECIFWANERLFLLKRIKYSSHWTESES